jgi:hypothetical protein
LKYEWKTGIGIYKNYDPQKVGEELERIPILKPQHIVEYAEQHKGTELYKCLEWDNTKAAKSWRKQQAADILRLIVVVETVKENGKTRQIEIRGFENANDKNLGSIYVPTRKALNDPEYRECILESIRQGIRELSEKGINYAAIIGNGALYQKGLNMAAKSLETKSVKGRKKTV